MSSQARNDPRVRRHFEVRRPLASRAPATGSHRGIERYALMLASTPRSRRTRPQRDAPMPFRRHGGLLPCSALLFTIIVMRYARLCGAISSPCWRCRASDRTPIRRLSRRQTQRRGRASGLRSRQTHPPFHGSFSLLSRSGRYDLSGGPIKLTVRSGQAYPRVVLHPQQVAYYAITSALRVARYTSST